jgi:hypothetical protein
MFKYILAIFNACHACITENQRCKLLLIQLLLAACFSLFVDKFSDINSRFCQFSRRSESLGSPALELNARKQNNPTSLSVGHRMQQESLHWIMSIASLIFMHFTALWSLLVPDNLTFPNKLAHWWNWRSLIGVLASWIPSSLREYPQVYLVWSCK